MTEAIISIQGRANFYYRCMECGTPLTKDSAYLHHPTTRGWWKKRTIQCSAAGKTFNTPLIVLPISEAHH